MTIPRRARTASTPHAPAGLRAARFSVGDEELVVLSFPLPAPTFPSSFSTAECEIAGAILRGLPNFEIAAARGTSLRTIANQVAAIFRKTGARSRSQLVGILEKLQRS